jgi:pimeloyl-ACP methyl ester carboxylesterase
MHPEKIVPVNGVTLCVQEFGTPSDPGVLLIGGAASSMDWWEDGFCERIAAGGRRVVRFDLRDTGRSTASPAGKPDYTGADLTGDVVALIDVLGLAPAHLVGLSMGGGIAQDIAIGRPELVATLTVMSTTPVGAGDPDRPDLPSPEPRIAASFATPAPEPDWADRAAAIDHIVAGLPAFAGGYGVDEPRARATVARMYDRTVDIAASQTNHWILDGGGSVGGRLRQVTAPTLVLHGTDDPLFPIGHGEAIAREIPGATLLPLPKVGHEFPPEPVWDVVVDAILRHTAGARRPSDDPAAR